MEDISIGVGTPSMALIPARNYYYMVVGDKHKITLPAFGYYKDIIEHDPNNLFDPDEYFCIYDQKKNIIDFAVMNKVLFALSSYPNLEDNTLFVPQKFFLSEGKVMLVGSIVKMISKEQYEKFIEEMAQDE